MSKLTPPSTPGLDDEDAEVVRREHDRKIVELQQLPAAGLRIVPNVSLADGVATPVSHGLGRVPSLAWPSFIRGASSTGRIIETRSTSYDRAQYLLLTATGWGATITFDLAVL